MDDLTKAFYETHAASVAAGYSRAEVAMDLLAGFSDCRKVLDLGCGNGRDLAALLRGGKDA